MTVDYEREYNNRARVPEHPEIIAGWARDAAIYREAHTPRVLRYGEGERRAIDLFEASDGPIVVLIHGGYWQALDKSFFSHLARGLNAHGVSVAVPSYDLCPQVRVGDIVAQMRAACLLLTRESTTPLVVAGHSAGGHLAACLLATEAHVSAAYSISGLFDLAPLISTSINDALRLDAAEAEAASPMLWPAPMGKTFDAVVGERESGEYLRQSADIVRVWGEAGVATRYEELEAGNHFTAIAPLADADSAMVERLVALARRAVR